MIIFIRSITAQDLIPKFASFVIISKHPKFLSQSAASSNIFHCSSGPRYFEKILYRIQRGCDL